ncbi:6966_t:CDS:2, partial [Cetraspora pellucida]
DKSATIVMISFGTKPDRVEKIEECSFFAAKYSPEQIETILTLAALQKKHAKSLSDEDEEVEENISSNLLANFNNSPANSSLTSTSILKKKQIKLWVENPEIKALFQFISPYLKLPDRKSLSNHILTSAANELQELIMKLACKNKIGVTIAFDGWHNIVKQEIIGIVFITSSGEVLIWRADDISRERQRKEEVISRIRALFAEAEKLEIKANYLTLDTKDDLVFDDDLKLPDDIKAIINHDSFWDSLMTLRDLLYPFCIALNLMQQNKARLYHVLHSFAFFMQNMWEQPILLLSFVLHPLYKLNYFNQSLLYINYTHMSAWLLYYFKAWFGSEPNKLLLEFELYKQQKYPFIEKTFKQFDASVERLFLLWNEKVIAMSQIRSEILRTRKPKKSEFNYNHSKLSSSSASSNQSQIFESNNEETDSSINFEDNNINFETDWNFVINEWEELLSDEKLDEEFDDEINSELDFYDLKFIQQKINQQNEN